MSVDVSVIIPTFRRQRELIEAIDSVRRQTDVTLQIIVVDDCPDGSARHVVENMKDHRVNYVRNDSPSGGMPSRVRNLGWPVAQGTYVHFLDDDDMVCDGHYSVAKEIFLSKPDIGMVFGRIEPFGDCPPDQLDHERRYFTKAARSAEKCSLFGSRWAFCAHMLFNNALLVCSASIVRRECIANLFGFDETIKLMEDAEFHVRVMRQFGVYFLDEIVAYYRIGYPSLMHSPNSPPLLKYNLSAKGAGECRRNT